VVRDAGAKAGSGDGSARGVRSTGSAQQAISLINDLLDLSRLDEDRLRPNIRVVEPLAIAARAVRRVTPAADLKSVTLEVVADAGLPNCETDANRVEQILINLLSNAIKYAPERSSVRMGVDVRGARVVFQIEDEGPGVPAGEVEQIFDIYVTKAGEESRGLGLGLPLSRRLARLLGGELHAVTRSTSGGCFVLEVPARIS
jgi:signal transduction histidine kinase